MEVIPIPLNDQLKPIENIRTRTYFILDRCLDEGILKNALESLIREHWRKLGARVIRRPKDGVLEYHLPKTFDEKYALFNWSSQEYDHSIDKVPSFPKATPCEEGVTLLPPLDSVESWFKPSTWPFERKDDPPNSPLLYVHISLFADTTVIGINVPHMLVDQFGMGNILKAWSRLISGQGPPPMIGGDSDIFADVKLHADYPKKEVARKGRMRVRGRMEYPFVILGYIPEFILHPKEVNHTLFLPLPLVESLREKFKRELVQKYGAEPGISNGDVITAIIFKFSQIHHKSSRMIALSQAVNLRGRFPQLERNYDAFIHNSLHYGTARFRDKPSVPLSEIAYLNRQAIIQALDPKDVEIGIAVTREMVRRKQPIHTCEPFEKSMNITNWCAAWKGLDFSGAIKAQEKERPERNELKMLVLGDSKEFSAPSRFSTAVMCKTEEGYWCYFSVALKGSKLIKEYLQKDPMLDNL
ncbi:hypothetical protein B7494_g5046 [Chlorociboria aeruginascens]|nr:hypothetical protein B7494_g5046 [Chlorociboria aeruginascens]